MPTTARAPLTVALPIVIAALLAACGGGGGGGGGVNPPSGGSSGSQSPSQSAGITGTTLANATVVFTCGCTQQAGITTSDTSGNYTIGATATAIPASPNPVYTMVPGRNYAIVADANHAQAWTMEFLGNTPQTDLNLSASPTDTSTNHADLASTAATLYVFYESDNQSNESFDAWNFLTISQWAQHLRSTALTAHEAQLLADVQSAQANAQSLYPALPPWNPDPSATVNLTIRGDLDALHGDSVAGTNAAIPTPCPAGGCSGAPTP